ncbi:MAG: hypothetical protein AAGI53_15730 [Planctomycetota bacterium]
MNTASIGLFGGTLVCAGLQAQAALEWDLPSSYASINVSDTLLVGLKDYGPGPITLEDENNGLFASAVLTSSSADWQLSVDRTGRSALVDLIFDFTVDVDARVEWSFDVSSFVQDPSQTSAMLFFFDGSGVTALLNDPSSSSQAVASGFFDVEAGQTYGFYGTLFSSFQGDASVSVRLVPAPSALGVLGAAGAFAAGRRRVGIGSGG